MPDVIEGVAGELLSIYRCRETLFCGLIDVFICVFIAELEAIRSESFELIDCVDGSELAKLLEKECRLDSIGGKDGELFASKPDFG